MKMEELEHAPNAFPSGVINFRNVNDYYSYVIDHDQRNYDVALLFILPQEDNIKRCEACVDVQKHFIELSQIWQNARDKPQEIGARKVFFGIYTFD